MGGYILIHCVLILYSERKGLKLMNFTVWNTIIKMTNDLTQVCTESDEINTAVLGNELFLVIDA